MAVTVVFNWHSLQCRFQVLLLLNTVCGEVQDQLSKYILTQWRFPHERWHKCYWHKQTCSSEWHKQLVYKLNSDGARTEPTPGDDVVMHRLGIGDFLAEVPLYKCTRKKGAPPDYRRKHQHLQKYITVPLYENPLSWRVRWSKVNCIQENNFTTFTSEAKNRKRHN